MLSKNVLFGLAQLIDSEKYSNLKLIYQGLEFKVYKAIICTQSPILTATYNRGF
jgi:hypothetical protein